MSIGNEIIVIVLVIYGTLIILGCNYVFRLEHKATKDISSDGPSEVDDFEKFIFSG